MIFSELFGILSKSGLNLFMYNVVKWSNILLKTCGVSNARFLKYVWPFYNIMHERVKKVQNPVKKHTRYFSRNVRIFQAFFQALFYSR